MDRELSSPPIGESCAGIKNGQNGVDVTRYKRRKATAAFGASCPLPSVPTNVRLLNRLPTLDLGVGITLHAPAVAPPPVRAAPCQPTFADGAVDGGRRMKRDD